jgi:L-threonylcarbamoyladenylate synthase
VAEAARLAIDLQRPDRDVLERAARVLCAGELVAAPSDTVYGLLPLPRSDAARERLTAVKGRPGPFIVLIRSWEEARSWTRGLSEAQWTRLERVWPGPVTVILPTAQDMPGAERGGIALRMPRSRFLKDLLRAVGEPLFSTSANRAGAPVPLVADDVAATLGGDVALILDGGPADSREPSTIVDWTGSAAKLVRSGRGDAGPLLDLSPRKT